jgi:hypothetical protein
MSNFHFSVFYLNVGYHVVSFKPSVSLGLLIITEGFLNHSNIKFIREHNSVPRLVACDELKVRTVHRS